eukprot:Gb_32647 [translate_table: standard]
MAALPLQSINKHGISGFVSKCSQNSLSNYGRLFSTRASASNFGDGQRDRLLKNVWPSIQVEKKWKGLLNPMDPLLKAEIPRYGDFAKICYDSFEDGDSKYGKESLLEKMGMTNSGYKVTKYLYANTRVLSPLFRETAREEKGVWIGFVAVCSDPEEIARLGRRDIIVAWRGTQTPQEWAEDLRDFLVPARLSHGTDATTSLQFEHHQQPASSSVRIEKGFLSCYTSSIMGEGENFERTRECDGRDEKVGVGRIQRRKAEHNIDGTQPGSCTCNLELIRNQMLPCWYRYTCYGLCIRFSASGKHGLRPTNGGGWRQSFAGGQ